MHCARWLALLVLACAGCDSSNTGPSDADPSDAGPSDAGPSDAGPSDAGPLACRFPAPTLGTSAEAQALASAPARCGQPEYAWLDDASLGDVVSRRRVASFTTSLLTLAFESQGVVPARPLMHDVTVDQLLYVTQDGGARVEATAGVAYPTRGFEDEGPRDVLLLLHGTAGFADACAPSNDLGGQGLAALFASWGYLVVAPDYIGLEGAGAPSDPLHASLAGQALAIASLDSVRALGKLSAEDRGGSCVSPRVLVYGASQGGQAALWVDRLAPYYASELELVGMVAAIPPLNVVRQAELAFTDLIPATSFVAGGLASTAAWYGAGPRLSEVFVAPYDTELPAALALGCTEEAPPAPDFTSVDEFIQPSLLDAAAAGALDRVDPWGCILVEADAVTTSVPRIAPDPPSYGILLALGTDDELVDVSIARAGAQTICEAGMPTSVVECIGASHAEAAFWSMPEALDFLDARAAGEPFVAGDCVPPAPGSCRGTP